MDAKLKAKWVKALRSGKYQQITNVLHYDNKSFCCLGVLSKVCAIKEDGSLIYPDNTVLGQDEQFALAGLNDEGAPFELIAGFINENL